MRDQTTSALCRLRWVQKVTKSASGMYTVTTKKDVLRTKVSHKVVVREGHPRVGTRTRTPLYIPLPSYEIQIRERYFQIRFAEKPKTVSGLMSPQPNYAGLGYSVLGWKAWQAPCMGVYEDLYTDALKIEDKPAGVVKRALVAIEYLQMAIPDSTYKEGVRARYAYYLGLLPDTHIKVSEPEDSKPYEILLRYY